MVDITLEEIIERHWLSVRSTNVCKSNALDYLSKLLDFFIDHGTFINLDNCGVKSDKELTEICNIYLDEYKRSIAKEELVVVDILSLYNSFSSFKKSVFNRFFYSLFNRLSTRAANGLAGISSGYTSVQKYLYLFFVQKTQIKDFRNIGKKTEDEIIDFITQIRSFLFSIADLAPHQLSKAYIKLVIQNAVIESDNNELELDQYFTSHDRLHLFRLLEDLLVQNHFYSANRSAVFSSLFTRETQNSLKAVADTLSLTRERVRQLSKEIEDGFEQTFGFVKNFNLTDCAEYGLESENDLLVVDQRLVIRLNELDNVNFNALFYTNILALFYSNEMELFDPMDAEFKRKSLNDRSRNDTLYLINKSLYESFDFVDLLLDVKTKMSERITDDYELYFEGYLLDFFSTSPNVATIQRVSKVCRDILYYELDLTIGQSGHITFERNVKKQMADYAYEVLAEIGETSHISRIIEIAEQKFPDIEFNELSFNSVLNREKELFISIGRSSTFGLKEWESTVDNLKGGTIKTIVEEFLSEFEIPKHISEIVEHVNQYRDTNERNVMTNLEVDLSGRFVIFPGEYVGLRGKNYQNTHIYKRLFGTHFRASSIKKIGLKDFDAIINYFVETYQYQDIQVRSTLLKRVNSGEFSLTTDNQLLYE